MRHGEDVFDVIQGIATEVKRFQKRIDAAKERLSTDSNARYRCKEIAALKRGALDLKNELTRITEGVKN